MFGTFKTGLVGLLAASLIFVAVARAEPRMHRGTVVSATAGRLVLKDETGAEKSYTVEREIRVMVHGKPARLEDLQETMPILVAVDEKGVVLTIATIDKNKRLGIVFATP